MHDERQFGRLPLIAAAVVIFLPAAAIIGEILVCSFSQWNMSTGLFFNFPTLQSFADALSSGRASVLLQQVGRAAFVSTLDILIAAPAAHILVRRVERKNRFIILVALMLPFFINSATKAFSWKMILGSSGPISTLLGMMGASDSLQHALLYNSFAVTVSLISSTLPFALFPLVGIMSATPSNVWELCGDIGVDPGNELFLIALPLARKGLMFGWIASFIIAALASSEIDFTGGARQESLARVITGLFEKNDLNAAIAMGILLLVFIAVVAAIILTVLHFLGRCRVWRLMPLGRSVLVTEILCLIATIGLILAPGLTILLQALIKSISSPDAAVDAGLSLVSDTRVIGALQNTTLVIVMVAVPTCVTAVVTALLWWDARLFRILLIASLCLAVIPGESYALGTFLLAKTLHLPIPRLILVAVSQTAWIFPFVLLTAASGYAAISTNSLLAARDLGASKITTFLKIIMPICWPEMILSGLVGGVLSMNDLSRAYLLSGTHEVISEYIVGRLRSGNGLSDYLLASCGVAAGGAVVVGFLGSWVYSLSKKSKGLDPKEEAAASRLIQAVALGKSA